MRLQNATHIDWQLVYATIDGDDQDVLDENYAGDSRHAD